MKSPLKTLDENIVQLLNRIEILGNEQAQDVLRFRGKYEIGVFDFDSLELHRSIVEREKQIDELRLMAKQLREEFHTLTNKIFEDGQPTRQQISPEDPESGSDDDTLFCRGFNGNSKWGT